MATNKFNVENTLLPQSTKAIIGDINQIDNFALKLNKCVNWFVKDTFNSGLSAIKTSRIGDIKLDALKYKKDKSSNEEFKINANFSAINCANLLKVNKENAEALCLKIEKVSNLVSNWRLIVGLGNESVYETSITLHHIYGIPYIPASGIKGLLHNWALNEIQDQKLIDEIFGTDKQAGKVIFFDAFPINLHNDSIQPDIMNPHYPDYYDGNKPPTDWQSPKPIFFLTLKDTNFEFIFGVKNSANTGLLEKLTKSEVGWLFRALKEQGIGAKTAVGYGRMYESGKLKLTPNFYNKKLKKGEEIEAEVIAEGNSNNIKLFINENDIPTISFKYGLGFSKDDIGRVFKVIIKNLKGNTKDPQLDENGLEFKGYKN
jgi:CRISPR-associated protein Cmr6